MSPDSACEVRESPELRVDTSAMTAEDGAEAVIAAWERMAPG